MPQQNQVKIGVFLPLQFGWNREVSRGIAQFTRTRPKWRLFFWPEAAEAFEPPPGWRCDGAIAHTTVPQAVLSTGVPMVCVTRNSGIEGTVGVGPDDAAISRLAAEHLREIGLLRMSFYGGDQFWSMQRESGFKEAVEALGARYVHCPLRHPLPDNVDWTDEAAQVSQWLGGVERPLGLLCATDGYARVASLACELDGLEVPEQVAIVGVDNDLTRCELVAKPLSSVDSAAERVGFVAAETLDRWLTWGRPKESTILIPPRGLVRRRSTDVLAIEDQSIARAVRFLRDHGLKPLGVDAVAKAACLSRSALEKRFRRHVGRSVQQEITRWRVRHACELLRVSDDRLEYIAQAAGFASPSYFHQVFKRLTGQTPASYRRSLRSTATYRTTAKTSDIEPTESLSH